MEADLKQISQKLTEIQIILARQEENLKEHMRRTELLEGKVIPLETLATRMRFLGTICLALFGVAATLTACFRFIH